MQVSKFNIYSIGYAAENKALDSKDVNIFPAEVLPYADGEIIFEPIVLECSGTDYFGEKYTVKVKTSLSIKSTWLQFGSNRQTAPDIRRGEKVLLWRYADTDKYYWTTLGMDDAIRRLETVVYAWSNVKDEDVKVLTPDNSYYIEISTHKKHVTFSTCKSDGEPFAYQFQFNTKDGAVTITDDVENFIQLDSQERRLTFQNKDESQLVLDKGKGYFNTPESIDFNTPVFNVNAKASINFTTKAMTVKADTFTGNILASEFKGTVNIAKLLTISGGIAALVGTGTGVEAKFSIPAKFTTTVTIDGIVFGPHTHTNPEGGNVGPARNP